MKEIFYFGCWDDSGHYLHDVYGNTSRDRLPPELWDWAMLDTGFCPPEGTHQGRAKLSHEEGWTILSFWDNTVDKRIGSHSTYVMRGHHTGPEMLHAIKSNFPGVFGRYEFDIVVLKS